jgi:hypothetical protein
MPIALWTIASVPLRHNYVTSAVELPSPRAAVRGSAEPHCATLLEISFSQCNRLALWPGPIGRYMCSYNAISVDGSPSTPACAAGWLLSGRLKDGWGADGLVVTDCGAIGDFVDGRCWFSSNHYRPFTRSRAQKLALCGGDLDS